MQAIEFIQSAVAELHGTMIEDVKVLNQDQLVWKPALFARTAACVKEHTSLE